MLYDNLTTFSLPSLALQEKDAKIQEADLLLQNKEAEFLQQLDQEKASTLTLLQVERQMWEAERKKKLTGQEQEAEWVIRRI